MAQYDGSIRINTKIDTSGLEKGIQKLEKRLENLEDVQKSFLEAGGDKTSSVYRKHEKDIQKAKSALESLKKTQTLEEQPEDTHWNQLRIDVDEYAKSLKELQDQGKFFGDEDYDKVYLAWKNATDAVKSYQAELNKQTESWQAKIAEQEAKAAEKREAAQRKAEEQAEKALQREDARIQKQAENEAKISAKEAERQAKLQEEAEKEARIDQIRKSAVVNNGQIVQTLEQIKQLEQEIADLKKAGVTEGYKDYDERIQKLSQLRQDVKDYNSNIGEVKENYKKLGNTAKSAFGSIGNVLKKANSAVNAFGRKIREVAQNHLRIFKKEAEKAKSSASGFAGRLKSLALSLLIFNQISKVFRSVSSSISEGFRNLYNDNENFKGSIDSLNASVLTLKNAFAAAFRPLVDVAVPYIQKFVEWLTAAVNLAGQFIAALAGRKTYTRAIKQTAKASEEAAEATEEETDAMKKQLSPLDDLNNLTSENNKQKDKGKDESGSSTGIMFEEVPIDSKIQEMADKVKDILKKLFAPLKKAWDKEGKYVMKSWQYALKEVWKLIKDIGRDFLKVWQQDKTVKIFENLLHIIGDIGLIIGHLARNFRDAWNAGETGLHILENIRDIIGAIVENFRLAADKTVEWADKLNFKPLFEAFERFTKSIIPLADALSGVLADFYTEVLLPLGKWTIEEGLPKLLDVFTAFNNKVDWQALRDNLKEFWQHLEPFAETVGEGLIIFIERVSSAIADFINSETFVNFLHDVEAWMDSVTPQDVADGIERLVEVLIGLKLALLGFSAVSAVTGVLTTIKNFLSFFGVGGAGATVAAGMGETATAATVLSTALTGLAAAAAVAGAYKLLTENIEELFVAFGKSADQGRRMEERYTSTGGAARFAKDGIDILKNGIEGYGFAADNCVGSGVALDKAMEDIQNGAILTDQHMEELQKRFSLTNDDMEMLRQEMLDANPLLREIADNFTELSSASPETLQDAAVGLAQIQSNGELLPVTFEKMTEEAQKFFGQQTIDGMDYYISKLQDIDTATENANTQTQGFAKSIGEGLAKGVEDADTEHPVQGFFAKMVQSVKNVFGIASPAKEMMPFGEYITLGILEGFKSKFEAFTAPIQQLCNLITSRIANGLQNMRNTWSNIWNSLPGVLTGVINRIMGSLSSLVSSISNAFSNISRMIRSVGSGFSGASYSTRSGGATSRMASPYAATPAIAALADMPIPGYATGQVIPRSMKQHLAILGDNTRETEVVSPISTIKQALREEAMSLGLGGGNGQEINLNLTVECEGYQLLHILQKLDAEFFKQNGRHAFA